MIDSTNLAGCIRRSDEDDSGLDYGSIDRASPPVFVNNTRTKVAVAQGRTARIECRVSNLGDRAVRVESRNS